MTYHLRRLRLHGLIERVPKTHRYRVTERGWRIVLFMTRCYDRAVRPGLARVIPDEILSDTDLTKPFDQLQTALDAWFDRQRLAA